MRFMIGKTNLEDPRKISPKTVIVAKVRYKAFSGTLSFGWTLEKKGEAGRPPSLPIVISFASREVLLRGNCIHLAKA